MKARPDSKNFLIILASADPAFSLAAYLGAGARRHHQLERVRYGQEQLVIDGW